MSEEPATPAEPSAAAPTAGNAGMPFLLAVMTLATVMAFDSEAMVLLVVTWCVVWVIAVWGPWTSTWSDLGRRVVLAVGAGWIGLWLALSLTVRRMETDGPGQSPIDLAWAGWPAEVHVGLVRPLPSRVPPQSVIADMGVPW